LLRRSLGAALALLCPLAGGAQASRTAIDSYTLPNGLRVHLVEDHSSQVVAVNLWYDVGSRNEVPGRTGFAHLFEHMMFQGSANAPKGEHMKLIGNAGGSLNGSTRADMTNYYEWLPSNRLNLALWLEADRMRALAITPENLKNQQEAVKEERRLRFDNQPYTGALVDRLPGLWDAQGCFAYSHSLIGSMDDLNAAKVEDVQAFFDLYYAPNNATLVIVGDFQPVQAKALIAQYFGDIPRGKTPPAVACTQGLGTAAQREVVPDRNATLPAALVAFRIPAVNHADYPALELLGTILGGGESSRFNKALVRDAKVALAAQALVNPFGPTRGPGAWAALAIANQGVAIDSAEGRLQGEIARVRADGVTEAEVTKAKNAYRFAKVSERQQALPFAEAVHFAAMFLGDAKAVDTDLDRYDAVTAADIQRVATTYLRPENALTLVITPEKK
jgi:predicted Zn-dependent peptidase